MSSTISTAFAAQYVIQIRIVAPEVTSILLNGGTGPISVDLPITNAGALVATVAVATRSSVAYTTPMRLEGTDAAKFALTNGGVVPWSGRNRLGPTRDALALPRTVRGGQAAL